MMLVLTLTILLSLLIAGGIVTYGLLSGGWQRWLYYFLAGVILAFGTFFTLMNQLSIVLNFTDLCYASGFLTVGCYLIEKILSVKVIHPTVQEEPDIYSLE